MMYKRFFKGLVVTFAFMTSVMLTGCNEKNEGPKVGPTITPGPSVTQTPAPEYIFNYSDVEVQEAIDKAYENMLKLPKTYECDPSKDYKAEKVNNDDGSATVYVYNEKSEIVEIRLYDAKGHITEAFVDFYGDAGKAIYGATYEEGNICKYFETEDFNGKFRIEITSTKEGHITASYIGKNLEHIEVEINK